MAPHPPRTRETQIDAREANQTARDERRSVLLCLPGLALMRFPARQNFRIFKFIIRGAGVSRDSNARHLVTGNDGTRLCHSVRRLRMSSPAATQPIFRRGAPGRDWPLGEVELRITSLSSPGPPCPGNPGRCRCLPKNGKRLRYSPKGLIHRTCRAEVLPRTIPAVNEVVIHITGDLLLFL